MMEKPVIRKTAKMMMILPVFLLVSCGYQFAQSGRLPENIHRVHIRIPENPTLETGLGSILANDLIREFARKGNLALSGRKEAEATLYGKIEALKVETISEKGSHSPTERSVTLSVSYQFVRADSRVLRTGNLTGSETFAVSTQKPITDNNRRIALSTLSERMAERVYGQLVGF